MKLRHILPALAVAGTAVGAQAVPVAGPTNTSTGQVAISGNVASLCVLGAPSQAAIDLGQLINTSGARTGRIAALGAQQVTLPGSFCNFAGTHLTVAANALIANDATAVQPGFPR